MSDNTEETPRPLDELSVLKNRARLMGLTFSNNISVETLKAKIQAAMDGEEDVTPTPDKDSDIEAGPETTTTNVPKKGKSKTMSIRNHLIQQKMRLVRLQIANMDPKKKDLPGEVFTVANEYIGTVRKYIPYGEKTDDGYHVPYIIYEQMKAKRFLHVNTRTDPSNGQIQVDQRWVREFSLTELEPLTQTELLALANQQAAAGVFATE